MLRLNLKKQQPLIVLRQCHIFARFLLVFLLLTMAVGKPNYLASGSEPLKVPPSPVHHQDVTTPTLLLQVLRGAPLQTSSPQLAVTDSPEFHLLPDPVVTVTDDKESAWRLQLDTDLRRQQGEVSTKQGDTVTHISEYVEAVGHEMSMALPAGRNQRSAAVDPGVAAASGVADLDESTVRNERSTNLSHLTGTARKIQMFVKNRYLQILPDGTVNGTSNDTSDFTILQRSSMDSFGGVQIQGVATCLFLCMNTCGLLYGAVLSSEECLFRENIEQNNYNTYSSVRHSNSRKTLYLALDGRGSPRKVQITAARQKRQQQLAAGGGGSYNNASLGKLSTYARVLTRTVSTDRVEDLVKRLLINRQRQLLANVSDSFESDRSVDSGLAFRHHGYHHLCPVNPSFVTPSPTTVRTPASRCPKKGKTPARKKRKKKCSDEEDPDKCKREKRKNMQKKKKGGNNNNNNMKATGPKRKKQQGLQTNRTTTVSVSSTVVPTVESSSVASD